MRSGGVAQVNHPNLGWSAGPEELAYNPDGALIEVWNGVAHGNKLVGRNEAGLST